MWPRHIESELLIVLLRGDGVLGKNAFTGGGKIAATKIADLVVVGISVRSSGIRTNEFTAESTGVRAIVIEGVLNAVKLSFAVSAFFGAGVKTNVSAVGVQCITDVAGFGASIIKIVAEAGACTANVTGAAALGNGSRMSSLYDSGTAALVADCIAIAVVRMVNRLAFNFKGLKAVLANGAANRLGSMCKCIALVFANLSRAGGAALSIAGGVTSSRIDMRSNSLAATLNCADAVAIGRIIVVANVLADGAANVTNEIAVLFIGVIKRLGSTASVANQCVAGAFPFVLLGTLVAATVITNLVAGAGVEVIGVGSDKSAGAAGGTASKCKAMCICCYKARSAAVGTSNGAFLFIAVICLSGCIAVRANGGAGMKPCVSKSAFVSRFAANVTVDVAGVGVSMNGIGSGRRANGAHGGACLVVGVLQSGACRFASVAEGIAIVVVGMCQRCNRRSADVANGAIASSAGVRCL